MWVRFPINMSCRAAGGAASTHRYLCLCLSLCSTWHLVVYRRTRRRYHTPALLGRCVVFKLIFVDNNENANAKRCFHENILTRSFQSCRFRCVRPPCFGKETEFISEAVMSFLSSVIGYTIVTGVHLLWMVALSLLA